MFDLNLLTIQIIENVDQPGLPGLLATSAPRRTARGRNSDQLVLLLSFVDQPPEKTFQELPKLLERLAKAYYQTSGPVTAGMRATAETLNQALLERNLRSVAGASQVVGLLNILVLHGERAYLGHAGPAHSLVLTRQAAEHYYEVQSPTKGLGLSRNLALRYYQVELAAGDLVVLSPDSSPAWTPGNLSGAASLPQDTLAQRLLNQRSATLRAAVVQLAPGTGKVNPPVTLQASLLPVAAPAQVTPISAPATPVPSELPVETPPIVQAPLPVIRQESIEPEKVTEATSLQNIVLPDTEELEEQPAPPPTRAPRPERSRREAARPTPSLELPQPVQLAHKGKSRSVRPAFARLWHGGRRIRQRTGAATRSLFIHMLPGQNGQPGSLSSGTMVFIAIAIPLVIVTLATMVYFQRGKALQYQSYFDLAQNAAAQAASQSDPVVVRSSWEQALVWLDKADAYQVTDQSRTLRQTAQDSLDTAEGITRLDYQPAIIGGLASSVQITRMVAASNDLYLLDSSTGRVIRASMTNRGYEVDNTFRCEKGTFGSMKIGDLVDLVPLPRGNEFKAAILALDRNGSLLYCIPGESPLSAPLAPPDSNWGKIAAFTYDSGTLYVLDTQVSTLWVYGGQNGTFSDRPVSFFETDAPTMSDVVDLAVNNTDLYLLHSDGHLTLCTLSYVSTTRTRCTDPAPLTDSRPGHAPNEPLAAGALFSNIQFTQPPDPSLYLLDPAQASIYHFSMRLNLQRILRAKGSVAAELPKTPVTAYTIGSNRNAFIAFGNQVFYALLP